MILEDDTKSLSKLLQKDPKNFCCLYWVYNEKCTDIYSEGYINKEVEQLTGISVSTCNHLHKTLKWKEEYVVGRPLLCHDKTYVYVKGKGAISYTLARQILELRDLGYSARKIGRVLGINYHTVGKWLKTLKWSKIDE